METIGEEKDVRYYIEEGEVEPSSDNEEEDTCCIVNEEKVTAIKFLITDEPINNTYVLYSTVDKIFGYQIIEKGVSKKNSIGIWGKQIFDIDRCTLCPPNLLNEYNYFYLN